MMKPLLIVALAGGVASPALAQGGCVGKVLLPPVETAHDARVLISPGHVEHAYVPAQTVRAARQVLMRPARQERVHWAAQYRMERSWVAVPGPMRWAREPDRYAEVSERVLVQPGRYIWERRPGPVVSGWPQPGQTMVTPTGVVMCKVWLPARYETVTRRVRIKRGRLIGVRTTMRREIVRKVLVRPAGMAVRRIPAEYRWISSDRLVSPARWEVGRVAARYEWRITREVHDGGSTYAPVICGGPLSRSATARMQSSLAAQGYDPGPIDGIGRPQTYAALHRFQVDHHLAAGQVTVESARALGVVP